MSLVEINSALLDKLYENKEYIAFFVYKGHYSWVIDWDENFNLNHQRNIDALCKDNNLMKYLPAGQTISSYKKQITERYREGIPILTQELFPKYRDGNSAKVVTTAQLRELFFDEDNGQYLTLSNMIEQTLSFDTSMTEDMISLRSRLFSKLPKFYINYDRKIFMHMVRERFYEKVVLDGWWGAQGDFEHMIPISHRYWTRNLNEDYWAVTNFSD